MEQRIIKFRAWDGGKMIYEKNITHLTIEDNTILRLAKFWCNIRNYSIIMQFTGLLDKNGKEVYEFDIVKTPVSCSVVEFDKGIFGLNHDYGTDRKTMLGSWGSECNLRVLHDGYNREVEVIGNIFETPELIK